MKIISKQTLADTADTKITKMVIEAPDIAAKALPGEFVVLMVVEEGERIPLTVVDRDKDKGYVTLIIQEIGFSTKLLGSLSAGGSIYALAGPLGHPTQIKNYGKLILVGGGVGIAEIYPVARGLKNAGNYVLSILGARTKDLLILEPELRAVSDEIYITTDDGSYERKGFVTDVLTELLTKSKDYKIVYTVGPIPMMRRVSSITKDYGLKTIVSLNSLMVDGTGMCGGCRVKVDDKAQFTCIDGPEFDAHQVDWDGLIKRSKVYKDKEEHICRLNEATTYGAEDAT